MKAFWVLVALVATVVCMASGVRAQPADKAAAEALFTQGRQLAREGKYDEACPKFAESQKLDPATGTLLNLADCYEHAGKTASAWITWLEAAREANARGQVDRERLARQRSNALQASLVYLTIQVPETSKVSGMSVTRNGEPVREALWGTAVPVDPDRYIVAASAPGHRSWQTEVVVQAGQAPIEVTVPTLTPEAAASGSSGAPTGSAATSAAGADAGTTAPPPTARTGSGARTWGWILTGVGAVGVGAGSYFGLRTFSKNEESQDYCSTDTLCSQKGVDLRDQAKTAGNISTVSFIAGGVALTTGVILIISGSSRAEARGEPRPRLSAGLGFDRSGGLLTVQGGFR